MELFSKKVLEKITADQRSNRWLLSKLKEEGIILTDTQISNRIKNIHSFKEQEVIAVSKILKIKL